VAEKRVDLVYDRLGQRASLTRYADLDGTKYVAGTDYTFDELGRLTDLTHQRADTVFADYDFAWDKLGQLTGFDFDSLTGDDGQTDYTYDDTGQLTDADYASDWQTDESYTYDDNGNRTVANSANYETGDHNRLTEDGTYRYEYDAEGNRVLRYVDGNSNDVFDGSNAG